MLLLHDAQPALQRPRHSHLRPARPARRTERARGALVGQFGLLLGCSSEASRLERVNG